MYSLLQSKLKIINHVNNKLEFIITPIELHLAHTLANLFRRLLFRFVPGYSVTSVFINNINSELDNSKDLRENTVEILNNIRNIIITSHSSEPKYELKIDKQGPCTITTNDIKCPSDVNIINKDLLICNIVNNVRFYCILNVELGIGYVPKEYHKFIRTNYLPIDSTFNPIIHVSYNVKTYATYEELIFYVKTNGSIDAKEALAYILELLYKKLRFEIN